MSETILPKLRLPLRLVGGKLATIEQDSDTEIRQCMETVCRFPKGALSDLPDFGVTAQEFNSIQQIVPAQVAAEIQKIEPRAAITATGEFELLDGGTIYNLTIGRA
ncbi:MAG: hypothetical protein JHC87_04620 [Thermoleophilaceae bacterium]|nr:hypothetical protein [Thermoleophilaceae bacterium]